MKLARRTFLQLAAGAAALPVVSRIAWAQDYPSRPVRVIVPFAPGGQTDVVARLIAQKLSDRLGKQFYVENAAGAGGNIGAGRAVQAAPDGHTILFIDAIGFAANPSLYNKIPYDPVTDFDAVAIGATTMQVLAVNPSVPAQTVQELVALIRANPGKYSYGSAGVGTGRASHRRTVPHIAQARSGACALWRRRSSHRGGGRRPHAAFLRLGRGDNSAAPGRKAACAGGRRQEAIEGTAGYSDLSRGGLSRGGMRRRGRGPRPGQDPEGRRHPAQSGNRRGRRPTRCSGAPGDARF